MAPVTKIEKVVTRTAYARNGNAHRPTQYYAWTVTIDGKLYGSFPRKKDAEQALSALVLEWRDRAESRLVDCILDAVDAFPSDKTECVCTYGSTIVWRTKSDALNRLDATIAGLEDDAETLIPHFRRNPHLLDQLFCRWQIAVMSARADANGIAKACSQAEVDRYLNPRVSRIRDAVIETAEQWCDDLRDGDLCVVAARAVAQSTRDWAERILAGRTATT